MKGNSMPKIVIYIANELWMAYQSLGTRPLKRLER